MFSEGTVSDQADIVSAFIFNMYMMLNKLRETVAIVSVIDTSSSSGVVASALVGLWEILQNYSWKSSYNKWHWSQLK